MKAFFTLLILLIPFVSHAQSPNSHIIYASDYMIFSPSELTINLGDTVYFENLISHNAVEVSEETYNNNGTTSNGGFELYSDGYVVFEEVGTHYYVCTPHVLMGMKGQITVNQIYNDTNINFSCDSIIYQLGQDIDGEAFGDLSGYSVSLSSDGNTVAIGAIGNDGNGSSSGHVRIYHFTGNYWQQLGQDIDGEAFGDQSGYSVSLSSDGNTIAIGATGNDGYGGENGHVRIYQFNGNYWQQLGQDIDGDVGNFADNSGYSVSLSSDGNTVAIGAPQIPVIIEQEIYNIPGYVRIYHFDGNSWQQLGLDIYGDTDGSNFGNSVSLSSDGNTVAIGKSSNGIARVYHFNGNSWQQLGQDIDSEAHGDQSGYSVSLSSDGNTVAIGAKRNDGNGSNSGHVRIYHFTGNYWQQLGQDIDGEDSGDYSGHSVSLSSDGNTVAIGATGNDGNGSNSGHVRIYRLNSINLSLIFTETNITACENFEWNSETYTESGVYSYNTTDVNGCDSTATLNLTINNSSSSSSNAIACYSYEWNGEIYTESGVYNYISSNVNGCDSTATLNLTILNSSSSTDVTPCDMTYIPDDNFEQKLIDLGYDDILDDSVFTSIINQIEQISFTGFMQPLTILDFTGIEDFDSLKYLEVNYIGDFEFLDLSNNHKLNKFYLLGTNLNQLILPNNIKELSLNEFNTINFNLEELTSLEKCTIYFNSYYENQTYLNFTQNFNLEELSINGYNYNLDFSLFPNLKKLRVAWGDLNMIDLSNNSYLEILIVTGNYFINNLDLSNNSLLEDLLVCCNDSLTTLNLKNGNNSIITNFSEYNNPNLYCINVDSVEFFQTNFISSSSDFSDDCNLDSSFYITNCYGYDWNGETYTESGVYYYSTLNSIGYDSTSILNLTINQGPETVISYTDVSDLNNCDGLVLVQTLNSSSTEFTYEWNNQTLSTNNFSYLCSGYNTLITTDENGCQTNDTIFVGPVAYGCMDENACNYDALANTSNVESCQYAQEYYDCLNECLFDFDFDGICDELEVYGCTDYNSPNYNTTATEDDGSCIQCNTTIEYVTSNTPNSTICSAILIVNIDSDVEYNLTINSQTINSNAITNACYGNNIIQVEEENGCIYTDTIFINSPLVYGCTDSLAINYNILSNSDDGTCEYEELENPCDITPTGLFVDNIIHNRIVFNWSAPDAAPSHYMIRYREVGTSSWTVMTAGPVNTNEFTGTSRTRYFMEPGTTYQWNIRARVLNEDGSTYCQSPWSASSQYTTLEACANLENLSASTEANWVTLSADAPAPEWSVWQSKGKIREVGLNNYRYVNGDNSGNINGLKGNFTANTDYEWHTKAWCTGNVDENGNSDPQYHSGWGEFSAFTTEELCDKLPINLSTSTNGANTAVIMSWNSPLSGNPDHYFLEMTNNTSGAVYQWNNIPGTSNSKTKFNQSPGDEISWRIRGACGTNGTSWATIFTQPTVYTLGGEKLQSLSLNSLEIYPNPSRDVFNIELSTENTQQIEIRVVNSIGQEVYRERVEVEGIYTEQIDLSSYSKGIYNLTIKTSDGLSNHKLILQ